MNEDLLKKLPDNLESLLKQFRAGKRIALARAISVIEGEHSCFQDFLHQVLDQGPRACRLGMTGPPGAGKSTLITALASMYRSQGDEVGIVAVDPTSPYSGGALLGDRIRMNDLSTDKGIFIRSMATRGSLGGLATTTKEVIDLMDAFGLYRLMVETVGVGQTELEITRATDTIVVVLVPESGDGIQAMKAGLMEIADIFVINKADRPGADRLIKDLQVALHLRAGKALGNVPAHHGVDMSRLDIKSHTSKDPEVEQKHSWEIPVLKTVAQTGEGVPELMATIDAHRTFLSESGELITRRRARASVRVREVVNRELQGILWGSDNTTVILQEGLDRIQEGEATHYSISSAILKDLLD